MYIPSYVDCLLVRSGWNWFSCVDGGILIGWSCGKWHIVCVMDLLICGIMFNNTMTLLKHSNKTSLLLPYEQLYVQSYHQHKQLISEQYIGEHNPIYQQIHNSYSTLLPTRPTNQYPTINTTKPVPS